MIQGTHLQVHMSWMSWTFIQVLRSVILSTSQFPLGSAVLALGTRIFVEHILCVDMCLVLNIASTHTIQLLYHIYYYMSKCTTQKNIVTFYNSINFMRHIFKYVNPDWMIVVLLSLLVAKYALSSVIASSLWNLPNWTISLKMSSKPVCNCSINVISIWLHRCIVVCTDNGIAIEAEYHKLNDICLNI